MHRHVVMVLPSSPRQPTHRMASRTHTVSRRLTGQSLAELVDATLGTSSKTIPRTEERAPTPLEARTSHGRDQSLAAPPRWTFRHSSSSEVTASVKSDTAHLDERRSSRSDVSCAMP